MARGITTHITDIVLLTAMDSHVTFELCQRLYVNVAYAGVGQSVWRRVQELEVYLLLNILPVSLCEETIKYMELNFKCSCLSL